MTSLKQDLAVVVSAEAFFVLTDLCGLAPDDAISQRGAYCGDPDQRGLRRLRENGTGQGDDGSVRDNDLS